MYGAKTWTPHNLNPSRGDTQVRHGLVESCLQELDFRGYISLFSKSSAHEIVEVTRPGIIGDLGA